jgi:hypothetical protein
MLVGLLAISGTALAVDIGSTYHITGCTDGELLMPVVYMWSQPGRLLWRSRVIGKLSGDGRADQGLKCQGSIVKVLDIKVKYVKVKSLDGKVGWVRNFFIGRAER